MDGFIDGDVDELYGGAIFCVSWFLDRFWSDFWIDFA